MSNSLYWKSSTFYEPFEHRRRAHVAAEEPCAAGGHNVSNPVPPGPVPRCKYTALPDK